jgi:hypothetical protein
MIGPAQGPIQLGLAQMGQLGLRLSMPAWVLGLARRAGRLDDEDITSMDTTILVPSCPKVNQLHIKIKFDTFDQLMLHYDFCAFSFSELIDWIKPCVEITWKT